MDSSKLVLLLSLLYILLLQPSLNAAQPDFTRYDCNWNNVSNYTTDSNFHRNLNRVLSSIASATQIDYGFYNLSAGEFPDRVNAFALCRGDVAVDVCRSCVNNSTRKILEVCPNTMDVFGFYDLWMIRYLNSSMFGFVDNKYFFDEENEQNVLDVTLFNQALQTLLLRLQARAASRSSHLETKVLELKQYMLRFNALLICPRSSAPVACMIFFGRSRTVVMGVNLFRTSYNYNTHTT
ncbi:hypothetical protein OIU76_026318 [Salix suchowensis]|nr:hypothetical protein OIU76_026318 [Salix suchowensis]